MGHVAQMVQSEMHPRFWWGTRRKERRHRLGDNNRMDLKEIECEGVDRIDLSENRAFVNLVMNI